MSLSKNIAYDPWPALLYPGFPLWPAVSMCPFPLESNIIPLFSEPLRLGIFMCPNHFDRLSLSPRNPSHFAFEFKLTT